ncbi:MAG: dephospho-CoA kinase [Oscillospiraceae bacterium]|nr:dephospho-CoA kinase [Oscillospiraceae bacterium]MBQ9857713.1 dephospho-CoA kinase [Oscillospiraceae bacterium]
MFIVGITGGTGAGKTTALDVLREMGGLIIDCDAVYHDLTANSTEMLSEINARFPGVVVDGVLQRKSLGKIVFDSFEALEDLNAITHKYVKMEVRRLIDDWAAKGGKLAAIDAIALNESGLGKMCDFTVAIIAPAEIRAKRIMAREGIDYDYAMKRIKAQKNDIYFIEENTYSLINDYDTKAEFENNCREFFAEKVSV